MPKIVHLMALILASDLMYHLLTKFDMLKIVIISLYRVLACRILI